MRNISLALLAVAAAGLCQIPAPVLTPSYPLTAETSGFGFSRIITVDHTKVPNTDQTNFPVPVAGTYSWLKKVADGGRLQSASGFDVIFTALDGTVLDYETEYWDTTGLVVYWVRVPTVSHTTDTQFMIWYGNAAIGSTQNHTTSVWNPPGTSDYISVWHGIITHPSNWRSQDSTGNHEASCSGDPTSSTAILGKAMDVGINADATRMLAFASMSDLFNGSNTQMTLEMWVQNYRNPITGPSTSEAFGTAASPDANGALRTIFGSDGTTSNLISFRFAVPWATNYHEVTSTSTTISIATYYYVVATMDTVTTANDAIYVNGGANVGTYGSAGTPPATLSSVTKAFGLGRGPDQLASTVLNGILDEVRVSKVLRSADWAATSYNAQSSPATFYSVGAEVAH